MIYIIGGIPGSGKSYLASQLAVIKKARVIELDLLMPSFNVFIAKDELATKLPVWQAKRIGKDPLPRDYEVEADTYWPAISALLNTVLKYRQNENFVIEGAQLSPELVKTWFNTLDVKDQRQIKIIFLFEDGLTNNIYTKERVQELGLLAINRSEALSQLAG